MQFNSRKSAVRAARALRARGQACKVLQHSGLYCQPGRGLASYCYYSVQAV